MTIPMTKTRLAEMTPHEAAAAWRVHRDTGDLSEAGLFEAWLAASEANRAAWTNVETAWAMFDEPDDPIFAQLRAAALADPREKLRWRSRWRPMAAAAAILVVIAGTSQLFLARHQAPVSVASSAAGAGRFDHLYQTAATDRPETLRLPDGSQLSLDSDTQVRVAFEAGARRLTLDHGRALFAVAHDADRPFSVSAEARTVVATGTRFEVAVEHAAMRVALYEGHVRVDGGADGGEKMDPGQALLVRPGRPDQLMPMSNEAEALWRDGLVEFDDATLADAVAEINKGSQTTLTVPDPEIAAMRVSGRYRLHDAERFARAVSEILPLRVVHSGTHRIELRARR